MTTRLALTAPQIRSGSRLCPLLKSDPGILLTDKLLRKAIYFPPSIKRAPKGGKHMARSKKPVNPAAENALDRMKLEVASELGIAGNVSSHGWSTMTSADCGRVGGHMVRKMIEQYQSTVR
jgi:small acid-soluble spore protein D (minor alpha/beta-type SASP)